MRDTVWRRRSSAIRAKDFFCGAGGSSEGMSQIPNVEVVYAANHWKLAVETHNENHPQARHDCADISQMDPRRTPYAELAWFSPECTNMSQARGRREDLKKPDEEGNLLPDEAGERSRATMYDVHRFAEHHFYRAIIVENVVDARWWCPNYTSYGRCARCRRQGTKACGSLFEGWLEQMRRYGYMFEIHFLNSMFAQAAGPGAPQSRDRMYVSLWQEGERRPDFDKWTRPRAHCPSCDKVVMAIQTWRKPDLQWGRYNKQYDYRCPDSTCRSIVYPPTLSAETVINHDHPITRLADRKRPLADKTMKRVLEGWDKYRSALQVPLEGREGKVATPLDGPWRTMTTRRETGILVPMRNNSSVRLLSEPFHTFCAGGNHQAVALPQDFPDDVMDWGLRCIEPDEIKLAMAFPERYVIKGNKREAARLNGNAVCPPNARDLGCASIEALVGELDLAAA